MFKEKKKSSEKTTQVAAVKGRAKGTPAYCKNQKEVKKRNPFLLAVGKSIVEARQSMNVSQVKLAAAADLGLQSVYFIERA